MLEFLLPIFLIIFASYMLKYSCDTFEQAAAYLGRNLPAGVKGATVNAIGSSMPELFVVVVTLFFLGRPELVIVGLGVTAGSAIFNGCVIPALSILLAKDEDGNEVKSIQMDKKSLIRDIFWVLTAELALIWFLGFDSFTIWMVVALNLIYIFYAIHLYIDSKKASEGEGDDYEYEKIESKGYIHSIFIFNFNHLLFKSREFSFTRAVIVLALAILIISLGSHILVEGVMGTSDVLGIEPFISGLIFGSAASSIPDLILSVKDSSKGEYEDAISNPLASNTFDTTVAFALPLFIWFLLNGETSLAIEKSPSLTYLRWSIIVVTGAVSFGFLFKYKDITKPFALCLLLIFLLWVVSIFFFVR